MKEYSPYRSNLIARPGKIFWANLLDYGLITILTFLLVWCVGMPVFNAIPGVGDLSASMALAQTESSDVIASTHLELYGEDLDLLSQEEMGIDYLETLAKTSFYLNEREYPDSTSSTVTVSYEETFLNTGDEDNPYPNDPLSYYFIYFKEEAGNGIESYVYDGIDYSEDKETYLYQVAMAYDDLSYFDDSFDVDIPIYQILDIDIAVKLNDYMVRGDSGGSSTYTYFLNAYLLASNIFVEEVESSYVPYIEAENALSESTALYYRYMLIDMTLCYVLAFVLLESIAPLVFKGGKTIGIKSFRLGYCSTDETVPEWWQFMIKSLVRLPIYVSCIALCLFFMSSTTIGILFMDIGGGFAYAYLVLASLLLGAGSLIFSLAHKEHQGFAEGAGSLLVKDGELFEASSPVDERLESNEEGKEGSGNS